MITQIALPKILTNTIYLDGLEQPLNTVAEILDEQGQHEHALAIRNAITIINVFTKVLIKKEATLIL
jgi:hypothetical protein